MNVPRRTTARDRECFASRACHSGVDDGFRYQDFNAATDEKADFGIAGLIAGGAAGGLLLAKKTGLIGIALLFLKKAWFLVVMRLAGAGAFLRKLFGGKAYKAEVAAHEAEEKKALSTDFFDKPASGASPGEPAPPFCLNKRFFPVHGSR